MTRVQKHENICTMLTNTYVRKNADYGNAFEQAREIIPNYTAGKLYDKVMRYINLSQSTNVNYETIDDTLMDLANYAIMELVERNIEREDNTFLQKKLI